MKYVLTFLCVLSCGSSLPREEQWLELTEVLQGQEVAIIGPWKETGTLCAALEIADESSYADFKRIDARKMAYIPDSGNDCSTSEDNYFYVTSYLPPKLILRAHDIFREMEKKQRQNPNHLGSWVDSKDFPSGEFSLISLVGGYETAKPEDDLEFYFRASNSPEMIFSVNIKLIGDGYRITDVSISVPN